MHLVGSIVANQTVFQRLTAWIAARRSFGAICIELIRETLFHYQYEIKTFIRHL